MKTYHFELILNRPTTEADDEQLFEHFHGRVSPALANGVPILYVHLPAPSMDHAIREAIRGVTHLDLSVKRIEVDPSIFVAA
ncbi:MAG: hypothetical protein D6696_17405 [Acidobacteria bacterium]|nr:MAG: hypothetical protein D6696_17405 [Acidobacteriota bacterium]